MHQLELFFVVFLKSNITLLSIVPLRTNIDGPGRWDNGIVLLGNKATSLIYKLYTKNTVIIMIIIKINTFRHILYNNLGIVQIFINVGCNKQKII